MESDPNPSNPDETPPLSVSPGPQDSPALRDEGDPELPDWKAALRAEFEAWLEDLDQIPELDGEADLFDSPDLYSFYEQWAAANAEARRGNRRMADAFNQWGETLTRFESDLRLQREQLQRFAAATPASDALSRRHCLALVELLDRLLRVEKAFAATPATSWWGATAHWQRAWESQRQAFGILLDHLQTLLKKEGVGRIETAGQLFDPTLMTAVASEPDASRPHQSVLEELAPGYRHGTEVLRPAQVKVSTNKPATAL